MIGRVITKYRENGPVGLLLSILVRLPGVRALCLYYVYRLSFSELQIEDSQPGGVRVVLASADTLEDILVIQNKPDIFRERFRLNHLCFLAYVDNEPVAYLWGQEGPVHIEQCYGFEVPIADKQVFYYDSHTRQEWRQKGFLRCLIQNMILYSNHTLQKHELVAIIEVSNNVSQKAHKKLGFVKDQLNIFINVFGKFYHFKLFTY